MTRRLTVLLALFLATPLLADRLPRFVLPHHYDLTITPDLEAERFSGEEMISVGVQHPVSSITLHAADIAFRSVTVEANGATQRATVTLSKDDETATLSLTDALPVGPATIRIAYDGILNRQLRGFYIGQASGKKYLASQMEAVDARYAFPSFDEPDMKATFRITVIADAKHNVISNSAVESESAGPTAGKRTVRFAVTPRLSTYHIALVVGDFACLSDTAAGIPIRICAESGRVEDGRFALNTTKQLLTFFNRYFEIDYPFAKLDQIALADFAAGAMENPGAITYRDRILLANEKTASPESLRASANTISHEIAHMWFGDMVTMRWWDDIWLNEGFASWLGRKGRQVIRPEWNRATADQEAVTEPMKVDVLASTRPIQKNAETRDQIEELFDGIAYGKTAALLRMLESYVGEEKFRAGINLYMRRNAFANASASDFAAAIDEASGREVAEIMSSYVNQAGLPVVNVRSRCEGQETLVDLEQSRFVMRGGTPAMSAQLWIVPVCFSRGDCVVLRERQGTFRLKGCRAPLFANAEGRGLYLTSYDSDAQRLLAQRANTLSSSERVALLRDHWFLVRGGTRSISDFLDLASSLGSDRATAREILTDVAYIERHLVDASQRASLQRWLRTFGTPLMSTLGWTSRSGETADDRELRTTVMTTLGDHGADTATLKRARELAEQWLRKRDSVDPVILTDITSVAAIGGDARLYDAYLQAYRSATDSRERVRLLTALGKFRDPALVQRTLDLALTDDVRSQDVSSVLSTVLGNPAGRDIGWRYVTSNWEAIAKKLPPGHVGRLISAVGNSACDPAWSERVRTFATQRTGDQARHATSIALERISACVDVRTAQQERLAGWLSEHAN
jgi:aminopeptidase N